MAIDNNRLGKSAVSTLYRRAGVETLGTFWLVFGGVGTAVFAGSRVGTLGIAFAFGLTVLTAVYAIGPISGAHLNPAVTVGLYTAGRVGPLDVVAYVIAQLIGAIVGAGAVLLIARGQPGGYDPAFSGLAANGFGAHSPAGYHFAACMLAEILLTFGFVLVVLGATSRLANTPLAGIAIGLALTLVHLIGIPITNTSVNPARSTGPALFVGGWATGQLWLFWVAPILGGILAGIVARMIQVDQPAIAPTEEQHERLEEPAPAHR